MDLSPFLDVGQVGATLAAVVYLMRAQGKQLRELAEVLTTRRNGEGAGIREELAQLRAEVHELSQCVARLDERFPARKR